jgi:hypothetical protein
MAIASIRTEKVVVRGQKCRIIKAFRGILKIAALPVEYVGDLYEERFLPSFHLDHWRDSEGLSIDVRLPRKAPLDHLSACVTNPIELHFSIGDTLSEGKYQELLTWLSRSGARLAKINRRLEAENAGWQGEEEVEI